VGTPPPGAPAVVATSPVNGASGVSLNVGVSATFNEAMNPATLTAATFTLTSPSTTAPIQGTVTYSGSTVRLWPATSLASNSTYTATIGTAATSASGTALATSLVWTFDTNQAGVLPPVIPPPVVPTSGVNLGLAGNYAILAMSGVSTVPSSAITGAVGISPAAATYLTGFSLSADPSNQFSTSSQVNGKIYAADYAVPTPSNLTTAVLDMQSAYSDAAGHAPGATDVANGSLNRATLAPGVYRWTTDLLITGALVLNGYATDVWIFQVAGNLSMNNGTQIVLKGGARPGNVYWQVAGLVDLGMQVQAAGIFLSKTSITLATGASVTGRLLAQTATTLDRSAVVEPAP
jgi:hypothetical protein